jgi:hypothetical protein
MAKRRNEAESASGIATVRCDPGRVTQFSVIETSASGDASVEVRTEDSDDFETLYDSDGNALSFSISGTVTHTLSPVVMKIAAIRVTSSNSGDSFVVSWR